MLREAEELSDYFNWHPADLKRKAGSYKKEKNVILILLII